MSGRGLHLALSDEEFHTLRLLSEPEQVEHIGNVLETAKFGSDDACETDKSWAYIHAALTGSDPDGPLQFPEPRPAQPNSFLGALFGKKSVAVESADARHAILGCEALLLAEDYYIGLIPASDVLRVSSALQSVSTDDLGQRVRAVHESYKASGSADEAVDYATGWYSGLVAFFSRAANTNKHVIFTVDF